MCTYVRACVYIKIYIKKNYTHTHKPIRAVSQLKFYNRIVS